MAGTNKKVLIISLSCFCKGWRKKFVFASKNGHFTFKFIVPHRWDSYYPTTTYVKDDSPLDVIIGRIAFIGRPSRHFYYTGLAKTILGFRPDIIHVEHEPDSLVALEAVFFRNLFTPQAKIVLRTSRTFQTDLRWSKIRNLVERYAYRESDSIFCLTQKSRDFLRQAGYHGPIKVHPNGVDLSVFKPLEVTSLREKLGLKDSRVIGYAGRLVREKGVDILIKAVAELNGNYKLLIVGDGPDLPRLKQMAITKNIADRLIVIGQIKEQDVPRYLNCMDILVLPSLTTSYWEEYFGVVLIEALACAVPVIGSTCGEIPNIINEKRLTFQEGQVNDLKLKLVNFFNNYPYWKKWAQDNIPRIRANYSWEVLGQQLIDAYKDL